MIAWALPRPDATAADMRGHDPDVQVVLSGGPGPQVAAFAQVPELAGLQHPVRLAADQHAPAVPECLIQMVGLERDRIIAVRRTIEAAKDRLNTSHHVIGEPAKV